MKGVPECAGAGYEERSPLNDEPLRRGGERGKEAKGTDLSVVLWVSKCLAGIRESFEPPEGLS